jgi:Mitochondrial carrier protein
MPESIAVEVLSASLGGAVSASVLYPLEVLKTKMQAETKKEASDGDEAMEEDNANNEKDPSELTMIEYSQYLYKNHGLGVFFVGVETSVRLPAGGFYQSKPHLLFCVVTVTLNVIHGHVLYSPPIRRPFSRQQKRRFTFSPTPFSRIFIKQPRTKRNSPP